MNKEVNKGNLVSNVDISLVLMEYLTTSTYLLSMCTGRPRFVALSFVVLSIYYVFYRLKVCRNPCIKRVY